LRQLFARQRAGRRVAQAGAPGRDGAGTPVFFSGIKVYLGQKSALFRGAPDWLRDVFGSPSLLQWAGGKAARTRPQDLGELTLSMLRGEAGNQARELEELLAWLKADCR